MKKLLGILFLIIILSSAQCFAAQTFEEKKKQIIALYNSNNLEETYKQISTITEDERDYEIWYILGNLSDDFNNPTNAVFFFQKSILLNHEFDKAHYNLANIHQKEKRYNSAINEYKLAIKYNKDFPYYYYNLGCAHLGLKQYKDALKAFNKAIKLKNNEPDFYYNLALTYKNLNKIEKANKALEMYNKLKG